MTFSYSNTITLVDDLKNIWHKITVIAKSLPQLKDAAVFPLLLRFLGKHEAFPWLNSSVGWRIWLPSRLWGNPRACWRRGHRAASSGQIHIHRWRWQGWDRLIHRLRSPRKWWCGLVVQEDLSLLRCSPLQIIPPPPALLLPGWSPECRASSERSSSGWGQQCRLPRLLLLGMGDSSMWHLSGVATARWCHDRVCPVCNTRSGT